MRTNRTTPIFTHESGPAARISALSQLRRSVLSCLLWEREAYEDGKTIASRIVGLARTVKPDDLALLAIEARRDYHLRHVPLLLLNVLSETGPHLMAGTTTAVIQRADEMGELLALYWAEGHRAPPRQMRIGLQRAFAKFDEHQLGKYNSKNAAVKLRDVLRIVRPAPANRKMEKLWERVIKGDLKIPDTWETALSSGADKRETFERLLKEGNLGYLALLRNLRNMAEAGVDGDLVHRAIRLRKNGADRVFPFRYVAAARAAPQFEPSLDAALLDAIDDMPKPGGETIVMIDVSGSMDVKLSERSDMTRMDAAAALGAIMPGRVRLFTFSDRVVEVPARKGMAGVDVIIKSQPHHGTYLGKAIKALYAEKIGARRLIVITDEQSADKIPPLEYPHGYMINVASNKNGIGYRDGWTHIDGFSEGVLRYINEVER